MAIKPSQYEILHPFQAWVQQTLPAIYDDSLSYTDLLSNMLYYIKGLTDNNNKLIKDLESLYAYINSQLSDENLAKIVKNKLDQMVLDGKFDEIISEIIMKEPYVNVVLHGIKNDGTPIGTELNQLIANNPNSIILFPNGTYALSVPIQTNCENDKTVMLVGCDYSVIKPASNFNGETLIQCGILGDGTKNNVWKPKNKHGAKKLYLDCNKLVNGIEFYNGQNYICSYIAVNNCTKVGIHFMEITDTRKSKSTDGIIEHCSVTGGPSHIVGATGIKVDSIDNEINDVRTYGMHIGFDIAGGQKLFQCHPVSYYDNTYINLENSIAFNVRSNDYTLFNACYSDNYPIGWYLLDGGQGIIENCVHQYYENLNTPLYFIKTNKEYAYQCNNCVTNFKDSTNFYYISGPAQYNKYIGENYSGYLKNLKDYSLKKQNNVSDLGNLYSVSHFNSYYIKTPNAKDYTLVGCILLDSLKNKFLVNINTCEFTVTISATTTSSNIFVETNYTSNNTASYEFCVANHFTNPDGFECGYIYMKAINGGIPGIIEVTPLSNYLSSGLFFIQPDAVIINPSISNLANVTKIGKSFITSPLYDVTYFGNAGGVDIFGKYVKTGIMFFTTGLTSTGADASLNLPSYVSGPNEVGTSFFDKYNGNGGFLLYTQKGNKLKLTYKEQSGCNVRANLFVPYTI